MTHLKTGKAVVCFPSDALNVCENFDGSTVRPTFSSKEDHAYGVYGTYKDQPTVIGGWKSRGDVETMTKNGWKGLTNHPRFLVKKV